MENKSLLASTKKSYLKVGQGGGHFKEGGAIGSTMRITQSYNNNILYCKK